MKLKKNVQKVLETITIISLVFVCSINDFELTWTSLGCLVGLLAIIFVNGAILSEYGRK